MFARIAPPDATALTVLSSRSTPIASRWTGCSARIAAVTLSTLLINLASPLGAGLSVLAWIAFAPWLAGLRGLRPIWAALYGFAMGIGFALPLQWGTFYALIAGSGHAGLPGGLLTMGFFFFYALPFAVFTLLVAILRTQAPLLQAGLFSTLVCISWTPVSYNPAITLVDMPSMLQLAAVGGEPLLLLLLLWPSAALANLLLAPRCRPQWKGLIAPTAALAITFGYGELRIADFDRAQATGQGVNLAALPLQLDLPAQASSMLLTRNRRNGNRSALEISRQGLARGPSCEVVVWPELPLNLAQSEQLCRQRQSLAQTLGLPLLIQCHRQVGEHLHYSAEWVAPGQAAQRWHGKSALVPVYERPLTGRGLVAPGKPGTVFPLDAQRRLIPTLCYELHSPAHLRHGVLAGGNFVAHMASFTPFAREPVDIADRGLAQLRAASFGVPIIRSANRGPAGWIDANGRVRASSARLGSSGECQQIWSPNRGPTIYARIAPIAGWLPALLVLLPFGTRWYTKQAG